MENIVARPNDIQETKQENASVTPGTLINSEPKESPFSVYAKENQIPFAAQYFGIDRENYTALGEADITNLIPKIEAIENYVLDKILFEEYHDSTKTFKDVMGNIKEIRGIKDVEPSKSQIEKIFSYINSGKPFRGEFHVQRSTKADEMEHARMQRIQQMKQTPNYRRVDNLFNKFFNK